MNLTYQEARLCLAMGARERGADERTSLLARADAISLALGAPLDRTGVGDGNYIPM